uniref:Uncharacterized protein n=1 Tax=Aegilops tauschii subsp. strangulata TaxID=200361 RepID=A0A452XXE3_AEGTS
SHHTQPQPHTHGKTKWRARRGLLIQSYKYAPLHFPNRIVILHANHASDPIHQ